MIPRIIHQAWFNPPIPERFSTYGATFLIHNPEWEYHVWDRFDVTSDSAVTRILSSDLPPIAKSDIYRYSVIYQYGGFWADTDCECLKSLEPLIDCDFVCGLESANHIGSAFFGAIAGHPLVKTTLDHAMENLDSIALLSRLYPSWIMENLGIRHFSNHICAYQYEYGNITIHRREYFFPVDWNKQGAVTPHSFINHHFAGAEPGMGYENLL